MSLALTSKKELLTKRAHLLGAVRTFFQEREVLEVDCPVLSLYPSIDAHIDLLHTTVMGEKMFLHSSPEYGMKRLLSEGVGDIYQLSHVFRADEVGALHRPEFTMIEWYRMGFSLKALIQETIELASLFYAFDTLPEVLTYWEAFEKYAAITPNSTATAIIEQLQKSDIEVFDAHEELSEILNTAWALLVEPNLGQGRYTIIHAFPKEQAALAQLAEDGTALRFELYAKGMELANGYFELTDHEEQEQRFKASNTKRAALGKDKLFPHDPHFLEALEKGIPPCSGVAMGFDRLMLLHQNAATLTEVLPLG